jgi:hypothetical protein
MSDSAKSDSAKSDSAMSGSSAEPGMRHIACERCGAKFMCRPVGPGRCWCGAETFQLPMPLPAEAGAFADCLCRSCLREVAERLMRERAS